MRFEGWNAHDRYMERWTDKQTRLLCPSIHYWYLHIARRKLCMYSHTTENSNGLQHLFASYMWDLLTDCHWNTQMHTAFRESLMISDGFLGIIQSIHNHTHSYLLKLHMIDMIFTNLWHVFVHIFALHVNNTKAILLQYFFSQK